MSMSPTSIATLAGVSENLNNLSDDLRSDRNIWKDSPQRLANILSTIANTIDVTMLADYFEDH
jgi:hypothetical protein